MAKVGRNNPCPCGSGKKYKKCCLGKDEAPPISAAVPPEPPPSDVEPSEYQHCEHVDGDRQVHPYIAARMLEDPELFEHLVKDHGADPSELWTPSRLAAMDDEEIDERLLELGADPSRDRFLKLVRDHTSAWELSRVWAGEARELSEADESFVGLAACELWRRHCPERPSAEMLDEQIGEGYHFADEELFVAASDVWLPVWRILAGRITADMRITDDAGALVAGATCLCCWVQDLGDALRMAALDDPKYAELGITTLSEILDAFPDDHRDSRHHLRTVVAQLHYFLGHEAEGERLFQELIADEPDFAEGWSCFADELAFCEPGTGTPRDIDRAVSLLEQALARRVADADAWDIEARLREYRRQRDDLRRPRRSSSRRRPRR